MTGRSRSDNAVSNSGTLLMVSLLCFVVTCLQGCEETPTGRSQLSLIPDAQLVSIGTQAFADIKRTRPLVTDPDITSTVFCIAESVVAASPRSTEEWEVVVFDDPTPNAFVLPGNKIGIHSGMLAVARTQGQLAAVISHEVGHLLADHANERLTQQLAVLGGLALWDLISGQEDGWKHQILRKALGIGADVGLLLPFSRIHEKEADVIGLDLMAQAGFDPGQSLALWQNMSEAAGQQPIEFLSTHPSHETRSEELRKQMDSALQIYNEALSRGKAPHCGQVRGMRAQ